MYTPEVRVRLRLGDLARLQPQILAAGAAAICLHLDDPAIALDIGGSTLAARIGSGTALRSLVGDHVLDGRVLDGCVAYQLGHRPTMPRGKMIAAPLPVTRRRASVFLCLWQVEWSRQGSPG